MRKFYLLYLALLLSLSAWAQEKTVTGTVTAGEDGSVIPGANVILKGTTTGVTSDADGNYSIQVPGPEAILIISFLGRTSRDEIVGERTTINVALQNAIKQVDEVVVTAFGIERERRTLGYSTQQVGGDAINRAPTQSLGNALQGKAAGLIVRQSSGAPGASQQIQLRGSRFFSGDNTPLFIVDGLPVESGAFYSDPAAESRVSGTDSPNRFQDINPEDIESVNILKGPTAAALYGVRASNGVVIITTKRGKSSAGRGKPLISISSSVGFDQVSRLPNLQNTYAQGSRGQFSQGTSLSWGPRIDSMQPYQLRPGNIPANVIDRTVTPQTYDNFSKFFRTGVTNTNNVDVSGGNDFANYNAGLGYSNQKGIIPTTSQERYSAKIAGDYKLSPKLSIGVSANYSFLNTSKIASGSNLSNPLFTTWFTPRTYDLYGTPYNFPREPYRQINYRGAMDNPRWSLANNKFTDKTDRIFGNTYVTYRPLEWLSFNARVGIDAFATESKEKYELGSGNTQGRTNPPSGGQIRDLYVGQRQWNANINATLSHTFGKFDLSLLLGNETYDIRNTSYDFTGRGISLGGYDNISNTSSIISANSIIRQRVSGFYGSFNAGWSNTLFLTATARQDYVSALAPGNRSFFYPSLALSYVFTETFNISPKYLSFGKLRASIAQVGQVTSPYATKTIFTSGGTGIGGFLDNGYQFPIAGVNAFTQSDILRSRQLTPQNTNTWEVGTELRFLDSRITLDYTYYYSLTDRQIFNVPVSAATGFEEFVTNGGSLSTRGHEVTLSITPVRTENVNWTFGANLTSYRNKVEQLAPGVDNIFLGGFTTPNVRAQAGQFYPIIYGSRYLRDDRGRIVVDDQSEIGGDPNPNFGLPLQAPTAGKIGNAQPNFEIAFNNSVSYKFVTLSFQLDWRKGGQMYGGNTRLATFYGVDKMTEDRESDFVVSGAKGRLDENNNVVISGDNDIVIKKGQDYWNVLSEIDEAHVYKTDFVRLREVNLAFTIPGKTMNRIGFQSASIYFYGRNLFLITDYPNFDPETSTTGANNGIGIEYVSLPQIRSYGTGIRLSF